jgi:hypothetical protein
MIFTYVYFYFGFKMKIHMSTLYKFSIVIYSYFQYKVKNKSTKFIKYGLNNKKVEISNWQLMWEVNIFHTLGNYCFKPMILHWGILYEKIHLNNFYSLSQHYLYSISNMLLQLYMKSENWSNLFENYVHFTYFFQEYIIYFKWSCFWQRDCRSKFLDILIRQQYPEELEIFASIWNFSQNRRTQFSCFQE